MFCNVRDHRTHTYIRSPILQDDRKDSQPEPVMRTKSFSIKLEKIDSKTIEMMSSGNDKGRIFKMSDGRIFNVILRDSKYSPENFGRRVKSEPSTNKAKVGHVADTAFTTRGRYSLRSPQRRPPFLRVKCVVCHRIYRVYNYPDDFDVEGNICSKECSWRV